MLTRLRFRRDFRFVVRCLSDKPTDGDTKQPETPKQQKQEDLQETISNTDKIQMLLKKMIMDNKVKDPENVQNFVTAPERQRRRKQRPDEIEFKTEQIEESITKAAGDVAQAIGGDVKQTEAELLSKVLGKINQTSTSLSDLITGMKVDRSKEVEHGYQPETRGQQVKRFVNKAKQEHERQPAKWKSQQKDGKQRQTSKYTPQITTVDIFAGTPQGIFKKADSSFGTKLETWEGLKQRELMLATLQPPANYFQKMSLWTQQGKIWKFPIDNEQGLEEEQNVHFSEHVFLDIHLEDWCPKKGPVRHFMELVCVGLSKNPFYTAQEKKDHILWYKEYFESKQDLLTEVGAWHNAASYSEVPTSA